jgi:ADP-heptose:LPS heptosyltransferase
MKILVIDLLRLGDFIQITPIFTALAEKYAGARIDALTFAPVAALRPLLPEVSRWWTLDRDALQAGLGRAEIPLLTSFDVLREKLDEISAADYDLVINLTQTTFSGWIAGYIEAREKTGLSFDRRGRALFHSPWFRYLDQHADQAGVEIFNHTDIFFEACGLRGEKHWPLRPTEAGENEAAALNLRAGAPLILAQLFTSEEKKTWPDAAWAGCFEQLRARLPDAELVLLGSPQEEARLEAVRAAASGAGTVKAVLSLDGALALLRRGDLLITGDTSIKHLANAAPGLRVLELSLGSSDHGRTGSYKQDSLILQARLDCAPCRHSVPCSRPTRVCAERLGPGVVSAAAVALLHDDWAEVERQAHDSKDMIYLRTRHLETGFWFAQDLAAREPTRALEGLLERSTWKFLLNQDFKQPLAGFGSESVRLHDEVHRLFPADLRVPLLSHLDFLDREVSAAGPARASAGAGAGFTERRRERQRIDEEARRAEIKLKLIRSLKSRWMESL